MLEPSPASPPPRTPRHDGITPERQEEFLEMLAATGSITEAAAAVGVSRAALYKFRKRPDAAAFSARWSEALREATAVLADDAFERAARGSVEPVWYKGEQIGERVRHNDRLLMFLLRAHDPDTYARPPAPARPAPRSSVRTAAAHRENRVSPDGASTLSTSQDDEELQDAFEAYDFERRRTKLRALRDYPGPPRPLSKRAARRLAAKGRVPELADDG
jgi:hypothetical protein